MHKGNEIESAFIVILVRFNTMIFNLDTAVN